MGLDTDRDYQTLSCLTEVENTAEPTKHLHTDLLWKKHEVSLLAKIAEAKLVNDFRPIAVLPVIYKLCNRVMYMLTETACNRLVSAQFAFRKCHPAHEVMFIFRQLVEKAVEWRAPHVYNMDGDIKTAYDDTSHCAFALAARARASTRCSLTPGYGSGGG